MTYPLMEIHLERLKANTAIVKAHCDKAGIGVFGVTKVFCAIPEVAAVFKEAGLDALADSRLVNLARLEGLGMKRVLLRLPMLSQVGETVLHADISLNSELEVMEALSKAAIAADKIHGVILMVDLGDLREGIRPGEALAYARRIEALKGVFLAGIGTNLTCYGAVIPDERNLGILAGLAEEIERGLGRPIEIVSGGNSSSLHLMMEGRLPKGINNLRLGEALVLGRETAYGERIDGTFDDVFVLAAELVEIKEKPTVPTGKIGRDAFGNKPVFKDMGIRKRGILALGRQDVDIDGLIPCNEGVAVFGASSDHMIVDLTDMEDDCKVGDVIRFKVDYGALMKLSTSEYVKKVIM